MIDPRSSLNIISLSILETVDIPQEGIASQSIEVSDFEANFTYTFGFVNLDLSVGSMRAAHGYHVIDC